MGAANAEGTSASLARADHVHLGVSAPGSPVDSLQYAASATALGGIEDWSRGGVSRVHVNAAGYQTYGVAGSTYPSLALMRMAAAVGYQDFMSWRPLAVDLPLFRTRELAGNTELYVGGHPNDASMVVDNLFLMGSMALFQNANTLRFNIDNVVTNANGLAQMDLIGSITTTDATPTTAWATDTTPNTPPVTANCVVHVYAFIEGRKTDTTKGAAYVLSAAFRVIGGVYNQIGTTTPVASHEDDATWAATISNTGGAIQVVVTGAAETIRWSGRVWTQVVA